MIQRADNTLRFCGIFCYRPHETWANKIKNLIILKYKRLLNFYQDLYVLSNKSNLIDIRELNINLGHSNALRTYKKFPEISLYLSVYYNTV